MSKESLHFSKVNGRIESELFAVTSVACIHVEKTFRGKVDILQRTTGDTDFTDTAGFDHTYSIPSFDGTRELDVLGYVFPKQCKLIFSVDKDFNLDNINAENIGNYVSAYVIAEDVVTESSEQSS